MSTRALTVKGIPASELCGVLKRVWPFFEAISESDMDGIRPEEVADGIRSRATQLWAIGDFEAIAVTRVTREAVRIERFAGRFSLAAQQALDTEIRAWARALGKRRVICPARKGFVRYGERAGYKEATRDMVVEIDG